MQSQEFASLYSRNAGQPDWGSDDITTLLAPADAWAARFGQAAHDYLDGDPPAVGHDSDMLHDYAAWCGSGLQEIIHTSATTLSPADKIRVDQGLMFHYLNWHMNGLWAPVVNREPTSTEKRPHVIQSSMYSLASFALHAFRAREAMTSDSSDLAYFDRDNTAVRDQYEGILNEMDTAIILMHVIRKRNGLTVVPAPPQFRNDPDRSLNPDFLVIDETGWAVGVQTMTSVKEQHQESFDEEAIVLVDGRIDLGNQLAKRTDRLRSSTRNVNWAGLICAHTIANVATHGNRAPRATQSGHTGMVNKEFLHRKMQAKLLLGGVRPNVQRATQIVGERVIGKLYLPAGSGHDDPTAD